MFQRIHTEIENNNTNFDSPNNNLQIQTLYRDLIQIRVLKETVIFKCIKRQSEKEYYAIRVPTQILLNNNMTQSLDLTNLLPINQLNKIKLGNLIHPEDIFYEQNCIFMTQQIFLDNFQLLGCMKKFDHDIILFIIAQLSITLQELQRRKCPLYNLSLETIYIIENMLHLSFLHFDFTQNNNNQFEQFQEFVSTYFPRGKQFIDTNFQKTTHLLLEQLDLIDSEYGCEYFVYLKRILKIENAEQYPFQSNSFIFYCPKPEIFQIYQNVKEEIFIKTPKFVAAEEEQINYQQLQNDRELEFNEELANQSEFATLVAYFRIDNQNYFLYPKYSLTLEQFFKEASTVNFLELQYKFAYQFALALRKLHNFNILHRDIKPSNVYLTSNDFQLANLKIADFDRSRRFYATQDLVEQPNQAEQDASIFSSTFDYDPPEALTNRFNFSSDIWQFGLTCKQIVNLVFQMANYGKYPIQRDALVFQDEDYEKLTEEYISEKLRDKGVHPGYIQLLVQCLNKDLNNRISLTKFIQQLNNIRIELNESDFIIDPNNEQYSEQSTGNFDNSINWNIFQARITKTPDWKLTKTPDWKLSELQQTQGDTIID